MNSFVFRIFETRGLVISDDFYKDNVSDFLRFMNETNLYFSFSLYLLEFCIIQFKKIYLFFSLSLGGLIGAIIEGL